MRDYGELKIPTERLGHNPVNGQFLKGHVPFNKGKKWSEYMKKRAMKRSMKGWENLRKYQPKTRPDNCGRCRKAVKVHSEYPELRVKKSCLGSKLG